MRFVADVMLKKLARWMRMLGYSVLFGEIDDTKLLEKSKNASLLTRDVELSKRAKKRGIKYLLIESKDIDEQLVQVFSELKLKMDFPKETRCPVCNRKLKLATRKEVNVPDDVKSKRFWKCVCGKVYWEGSHWLRIRERVKHLRSVLKLNQPN